MFESLGVEVLQAHTQDQALEMIANEGFDLVVVNRKLDNDYSDGTDLITKIKSSPEIQQTRVMLVSNLEDAQQEAVQLGAEPGFGKLQLSRSDLRARLKQFFSPTHV